MKPFFLLVKPVSADCNLSCDYCFYRPALGLYPEQAKHGMPDNVLEQVIKTYMQTPQPVYSICWQGGEPTLGGVDFFKRAVEFQKRYGRPGALVSNSIQTNATRISDEMAKFFSQYRFLAGCSLDGPERIHNHYRRTHAGKKTFKKVLKGIKTLQRNKVEFNILTLVSRANKDRAAEIYRFLKQKGFYFHQYIPCTEFDDKRKALQPFSITGEEWGRFLSDLFDAWYPEDTAMVSIQNFETVLSRKIDGSDSICVTANNCCKYFVVEHNGDVYPCDFFVAPGLRIGNIMEDTWEQMQNAPAYQAFGRQKSDLNVQCKSCPCLDLCAGDCLKNRMYLGNPPSNLSILCNGIQGFINHTRERFDALGRHILDQRERER